VPYAEAHGARIYYETSGDGEPLLIIPGFGANGTLFRKSVPPLSERFRVVILDQRGAGRSDQPAGAYTMELLADDCAAVLDAAGVESAHVFGTSLGGMVALHVGLRHPARVRSLALVCATAGGAQHVQPTAETMTTFMAAGSIEDPTEAVRSTYRVHYSDAWAAAHDTELVAYANATRHLRQTPVGREGQAAAAQSHDVYDRLGEITAPTLVVHGADDPLVPPENGRILAERIPNARLSLYEGARHVFFVECADRLNAEIAAFAESTDAARFGAAAS
jgi:3-oxoadipate enol-lactonase